MYSFSSDRAGTSSGNNKVIPMKRKAPLTNVLIIDDDQFFRDSLCDFLVEDGDVNILHRCGSYTEAKEWCSSGDNIKSVNAIILDVMLPYTANEKHPVDQRVGLIILEKLRNQVGFTGPIIMLTNSDDNEDGKEALAKGCSAYLCKHASTDAIPKMVTELKLALTGDVLLVPNKLRHLIVPSLQQSDESRLHQTNNRDNVINHLGQNPAWMEIKKELGYDNAPRSYKSTSTRMQAAMAEHDLTTVNEHGFYGSSASLVRHFMENAPRPIFITTADDVIEFVNKAAELMFGRDKNHLLGRSLKDAIPSLTETFTAGSEVECYIHNSNGVKIPVSVATSQFQDGVMHYTTYIFTDLTPQKTTEQRLKAMVTELEQSSTRLQELVKTDPLTGILNRRGLESVLNRELSLARRNGDEVVGIVIDLDNFKGINDGYGHAAGDLVLKTVANVLQEDVRTSDWVGRVGGDEFMVFLPSTNLENAAMIAERIRSSVASAMIQKNGQLIKATTSIGVASLPHDVDSLEQVLELTKSGLKSSKRRGKNTVSISAHEGPRTQRYSTEVSGTTRGMFAGGVEFVKRLFRGQNV
jgi:diguanylate cyclase (GGDEF)-like protein/PAS domain S-box-containing protein